jgi:hypothetical protein
VAQSGYSATTVAKEGSIKTDTVRMQGFVRDAEEPPLLVEPSEPEVWLLNRLRKDEDDQPLQEGIFSNYNDDIILETDSNTLLGRYDPARGPAQSLIIGDGLRVENGVIIGEGGAGGGVFIGDAPPPNPKHGMQWWHSGEGITYVYFDDGSSRQWVIAHPLSVKGDKGDQGPVGPTGASSSMWLYRFDSNTAANDPGAGRLRFNSTIMANVTHIYFDRLTQDGLDPTTAFTAASFDDQFVIQERGLAAHNINWKMTGPAVPMGGGDWFDIPVQVASQQGSNFNNNLEITVLLRTTGQQGAQGPQGIQGIQGPPGPWTQITQAAYNALSPPNPATLYVIIG